MSASSFIAKRYFKGRKKLFVSFLSFIATTGVFLGVFSLVVVMSVMLGFSKDVEKKLLGFNAHIVIEGATGEFTQDDNVRLAMDIVEGEGIAEVVGSRGKVSQGIKIRGMDKEDIPKMDIDFYFPDDVPEYSGAILGSELSFQLGVDPGNGDEIKIIVPIGSVGPTGDIVPNMMTFGVGGAFRTGYFEHDNKVVIISKKSAVKLLGDNAVRATHIWLKNSGDTKTMAAKLAKEYPSSKVLTWAQMNKKLFAALKLERFAMTGLLVLIIIMAGISIASVIFMYVFIKRKDIAMLSCVGASKFEIRKLFIKIGAYIGIVGTLLGLICGLAVCVYLMHNQIMLPESYYLDYLPVTISWPFIIIAAAVGISLSMAAAIYPAIQASRMDPVEALRYE